MMYDATCHCGAIKLQLQRLPQSLTSCNCSICHRYGALFAYYDIGQVEIVAKQDDLSGYSWQKELIIFHHCRVCGCVTHYTTTPKSARQQIAINARLLPLEMIADIPVRKFDGADTWTFINE